MLGLLVALVIGSIAAALIFSRAARDLVVAVAILAGFVATVVMVAVVWLSPAIFLLAVAWFLWSRS